MYIYIYTQHVPRSCMYGCSRRQKSKGPAGGARISRRCSYITHTHYIGDRGGPPFRIQYIYRAMRTNNIMRVLHYYRPMWRGIHARCEKIKIPRAHIIKRTGTAFIYFIISIIAVYIIIYPYSRDRLKLALLLLSFPSCANTTVCHIIIVWAPRAQEKLAYHSYIIYRIFFFFFYGIFFSLLRSIRSVYAHETILLLSRVRRKRF